MSLTGQESMKAMSTEEAKMSTSQSNCGTMRYSVSYTYDSPGPAGPFKGQMVTDRKYVRGDSIRAAFGGATVKSCRVVKP